jgi:hypothetical protein
LKKKFIEGKKEKVIEGKGQVASEFQMMRPPNWWTTFQYITTWDSHMIINPIQSSPPRN